MGELQGFWVSRHEVESTVAAGAHLAQSVENVICLQCQMLQPRPLVLLQERQNLTLPGGPIGRLITAASDYRVSKFRVYRV